MALKIVAVRPSNNPDAQKSADGKFSVMADGRQYFMCDLKDTKRPTFGIRTRMFAQQFVGDTPQWKIDLADFKAGTTYEGHIETVDVEPYAVGDRTVSQYTFALFEGESKEQVCRRAGHELRGAAKIESVEVVDEMPA